VRRYALMCTLMKGFDMQKMTVDDWLAPLKSRGLLPAELLAVYVVGSVARGWQNARSDFDIYVVSSGAEFQNSGYTIPVPLDPPFVPTETFYEADKRWEIKYWLDSQIDQMITKVSWEAYEAGMVAGTALTLTEELSLARLGNCLPLIDNDWLRKTQERLAGSAFRSFAVVRSLGAADNAVEDALGQMESGDLYSATISARLAFGHAIDALLEGEGEYGSHLPKWRANRFKAAAPSAISFEDYWAIETMQAYDSADPRAWITNVLTICQDIAMRVETS
jgi:predicted nucleotidyltransferase